MRTTGCPARSSAVTAASCSRVGRRRPDVDEEAIVAVALGRADAARDRSGRSPCPPCPTIRRPAARSTSRSWRCRARSPASACRGPPGGAAPIAAPSTTPGLSATGTAGARGGGELHARADQRADVGADQRRRHQAEVRQRRVAPADVGRVDEHAPVVLLLGELAEARRRIGDGDEVRARASRRRRRCAPASSARSGARTPGSRWCRPTSRRRRTASCGCRSGASTARDRRRIGVVEDVQRRPAGRAPRRRSRTSGHSELPPIPSSTTSV